MMDDPYISYISYIYSISIITYVVFVAVDIVCALCLLYSEFTIQVFITPSLTEKKYKAGNC